MPVTLNDILAVIKARPKTIPAGLDDAAIQSYIDEAKPIMLEYCMLPQNIQEIPDVLKYPWVEIATVLMNNSTTESYSSTSTSSGKIKSVTDGDTTVQFGADTAAKTTTVNRAEVLNNMSVNNIRIMNGFRRLF